MTQYYGPGATNLVHTPSAFVNHPQLGTGVVLGKYSFTDGGKKEVKNYDEREITVTDKQYNDALDLAKESGRG